MPRMQAVYYRAGDGSEPVDTFVEELGDPNKQAALARSDERQVHASEDDEEEVGQFQACSRRPGLQNSVGHAHRSDSAVSRAKLLRTSRCDCR